MADRPIAKLYKAIKTAEEGKLFKYFGRAERLKGEYPTGTLRKRAEARTASMDVRVAKTLEGTSSEVARTARIAQKAALRGIKVAGRIGSKLGSKLGGKLGMLSLPSQYLEYKEMMKPLHKREQEASARRI